MDGPLVASWSTAHGQVGQTYDKLNAFASSLVEVNPQFTDGSPD